MMLGRGGAARTDDRDGAHRAVVSVQLAPPLGGLRAFALSPILPAL